MIYFGFHFINKYIKQTKKGTKCSRGSVTLYYDDYFNMEIKMSTGQDIHVSVPYTPRESEHEYCTFLVQLKIQLSEEKKSEALQCNIKQYRQR